MDIKSIKDFPGYKITNQGTIIGKHGQQLKPRSNGYYQYCSMNKDSKRYTKSIHCLVLETFVGPRPNGKEANHKDGRKFNNLVGNLEWVTRSENLKHAFLIGLKSHKGENHNLSKLKSGEVWLIKRILSHKVIPQCSIAKMFNVVPQTISDIKLGKRWSNIE